MLIQHGIITCSVVIFVDQHLSEGSFHKCALGCARPTPIRPKEA